jgi:hypothetical protein
MATRSERDFPKPHQRLGATHTQGREDRRNWRDAASTLKLVRPSKGFSPTTIAISAGFPQTSKKVFERISEDHERAANATAIPGFGRKIWKYRCKSADLERGSQGGFRIIAYHDDATGTLYPILLYSKTDRGDVTGQEITDAVEASKNSLQDLVR